MKLFQDLKYVGNDSRFKLFEDTPWHCTSFVTRFKTDEMEFCLQQPYYHNGIFIGYAVDTYVLTENELVDNFKIIKEDGSLESIQYRKDNKELQKKIQDIDKYFKNMTNE